MNIIATQYEAMGIEGSDAGTFMQAIPYQFYAILALVLIPVIALSKKNFGPMAHSEQLALKGLTAEQMTSEDAIVVEDDKDVDVYKRQVQGSACCCNCSDVTRGRGRRSRSSHLSLIHI